MFNVHVFIIYCIGLWPERPEPQAVIHGPTKVKPVPWAV